MKIGPTNCIQTTFNYYVVLKFSEMICTICFTTSGKPHYWCDGIDLLIILSWRYKKKGPTMLGLARGGESVRCILVVTYYW